MSNPNLQDVPHPKPIGGTEKHWPENVIGREVQNPRRSPLAEINPHLVPNRDESSNRP